MPANDATLYDKWHQNHAVDNDVSTPWYEFAESHLSEEDIDGKDILEIGCGRGGFSGYFVERFPLISSYFACDYSVSAIRIGKAKYGTGKINWQQENIMNLSFSENRFDTIICCETIEHVPYPSQAIKELYRTLKPNGKLILTCPNYFNLFGIWCFYRWILRKPYTEGGQPYVNYILAPRVLWLAKKYGFHRKKFFSRDITIPARVPKHIYNSINGTPKWLRIFGNRTGYVLHK